MTDEQGQTLLYTLFGTTSPHWRLTSDSDALHFAEDENANTNMAVPLTPAQASLLRAMTVITSSINLTLSLHGEPVPMHFVGRKVNQSTWAGTSSAWGDTSAVARDLTLGLSFAEQVVSEANSVIVILDQRGNIQRFNRLSEEYTGLKEQEVIGRNVFQLFMTKQEAQASRRNIAGFFREGSSYEVERWIKTRKGQRLFLFRNKFVHSGSGKNEIFLICSGTDITEERRAQERLRVLANTDTVTGLPNRNAIHQQISLALELANGSQTGVVYLDLDNFKKVNDAYGHMFGDQLLQAVSLAILSCLGKDQTLARLGGDEFVVLAEHTSQAALEAMASRILERLRQPFRIGLIEVYSGCSIGIALAPLHGEDRESLIRNADTAMYHAKENGRGKFCVFANEMNQRVFEYLWLDTNLRKALELDHLVVHYQPKLNAEGDVLSAEALVRWNSPERGLVPPGDFISYAEESGLIVPLGRWVMLNVLQQIIKWRSEGIYLRVAVNVSAKQLIDQSIYTDLKHALNEAGLTDCPIDIELTESCLIENEAGALMLMKQFQELGAQVHLDDFGTGYSSLSQLARVPIDAIKLDQSFVRNINKQPVAQSLVRAIVAVAKALKLQVIAEGIETKAEEKFVMANGVDGRQGYYYAKPMPAEELGHWLAKHPARV
ncbi:MULTISPECIES: cyclic di-GMP phosphodiesterase [Enterobacterales]|jgi:cyclic di-GMP phosphodiesterase Gmr|uniref:Cyclic di-GMP phosphodiesterase Gmr n=2 Tax=Pantoea TaxID=53335 RepID=A0A1I3TMX3_9GAMM|nr:MULTISPECIES: cyclic di-GMP phosphodiesterase [Enterobacterales]MDY0926736.1 cyclic di-GMP phosphodiesterase [Enterobacter sp. CFBP8995]MRS20623.1 cyclic di-GMP phosphodiesterase [Enterobacteriaceae bacterium RIT692]MRT25289.1 cyclic di-GMP phosphodiesterase [Enterobacteriaceae bacterium RIT697]MRT42393.1 cyclic di-GMP phosphodiesterase [Enterobacteriaceae bacterium RIT702]KAJ9432982.1 cyclic di-GMP phosphodiesterase [Pantoea sp. YR343]